MSRGLKANRAETPQNDRRTSRGGLPARRAMNRWAWRLFRREWRQQLLVLVLVLAAVAATVIGATVATNDPPPANTGFGTAGAMFSAVAPDPHLASQIATLRQRSGPASWSWFWRSSCSASPARRRARRRRPGATGTCCSWSSA